MSDSLLSILSVLFILICLCAVIAFCASILRSADKAIRQQLHSGKRVTSEMGYSRALTSSITADEIIDLHLALQQITNLRSIAQEVSIG